MTNLRTLETLHQRLSQMGYESEWLAKDDESPFDRVLIALDEDLTKETYEDVVQIFFMEDVLNTQYPAEEQNQEGPSTLNFVLGWPHISLQTLSPENQLNACKLVMICNKLLPLGALGFHLENESLYYSYALIAEDQNRNAVLISEIIDMLSFYLPQVRSILTSQINSGQSIEAVLAASGLMSVFQELKQN